MDKTLSDDCANLDGVYINTRQNVLKTTTEQNQWNFTKNIYIYVLCKKKEYHVFLINSKCLVKKCEDLLIFCTYWLNRQISKAESSEMVVEDTFLSWWHSE